MGYKVLLVDDDEAVRSPVRRYLQRSGFEVCEADTASTGEHAFRAERPDAVVLDYSLPDGDALNLLPRLKAFAPDVPVLILTGYGTIDMAVRAVKEGAENLLTKPVELGALAAAIDRSLDDRPADGQEPQAVDPFMGTSEAVRVLAEDAHVAVRSDSPILIQGETGSGKGVLARWLHDHGTRGERPFVALNCSGLAAELLQSELFGHKRGSFTGAVGDKQGLFEVADGGTVFLDEIGDMELQVQPKLLTVLEEKTFRRLGGVRERNFDYRLIAAGNRDLGRLVQDGHFRADLYFRLSTIVLRVPPLRERRADLPLIVERLLTRQAAEAERKAPAVSGEAMALMSEYSWPGNFRELRNVLERALLAVDSGPIRADHLRFDSTLVADAAPRLRARSTLKDLQREHIKAVLIAERGHMVRCAERLGVARSTLYEKLKALSIDPADYR